MDSKNECVRVSRGTFDAVGLKWEGTFAEAGAGGIRAVQTVLQSRIREIMHIARPEILLGLSYHVTEGGFTHYAAVEVERVEAVPEGMTAIAVPAKTYARREHRKGQSIDASYSGVYAWIESQGYRARTDDLTHLEEYPMAQDPYDKDPEFVILLPMEPVTGTEE